MKESTIFNQENEQENERGRAADNDWASTRQFALWAPSEKSRSFPERPRPVKSQNLASSRLTAKRMSDAASTQAPTAMDTSDSMGEVQVRQHLGANAQDAEAALTS